VLFLTFPGSPGEVGPTVSANRPVGLGARLGCVPYTGGGRTAHFAFAAGSALSYRRAERRSRRAAKNSAGPIDRRDNQPIEPRLGLAMRDFSVPGIGRLCHPCATIGEFTLTASVAAGSTRIVILAWMLKHYEETESLHS